jgi:hypothetical protein
LRRANSRNERGMPEGLFRCNTSINIAKLR